MFSLSTSNLLHAVSLVFNIERFSDIIQKLSFVFSPFFQLISVFDHLADSRVVDLWKNPCWPISAILVAGTRVRHVRVDWKVLEFNTLDTTK